MSCGYTFSYTCSERMHGFDQDEKVRAQSAKGQVSEAEDCADQVQADMRHVPTLSVVAVAMAMAGGRC